MEGNCGCSPDDVAGVAVQVTPKGPSVLPGVSSPLTVKKRLQSGVCVDSQLPIFSHTQNDLHNDILSEKFSRDEEREFYFEIVLGKSCLGVTALDGFTSVTLDRLEEAFPRDRFLALDVETTGLAAACDGVRVAQLADGESAAMPGLFSRA